MSKQNNKIKSNQEQGETPNKRIKNKQNLKANKNKKYKKINKKQNQKQINEIKKQQERIWMKKLMRRDRGQFFLTWQ